jgi:hypothetical protein
MRKASNPAVEVIAAYGVRDRSNCAFGGPTFEFWAILFPEAHSIEWSSESGWRLMARRRRGMHGLKLLAGQGDAE